ncbi:MAG: hypothetical protein VKJ04_04950 [Vampirovibrionales bacterium]|nr:hypothetical protein [Vampirovibrionales bacterium]
MSKSNQKRYKELKTVWFVGFILLLVFAVFVILKRFTGEDFYVESYRPSVNQANEYRRMEAEQAKEQSQPDDKKYRRLDESRDSEAEPRPYGFSERDIDKSSGSRYKTF